jgi:hypothetical protein
VAIGLPLVAAAVAAAVVAAAVVAAAFVSSANVPLVADALAELAAALTVEVVFA